MLDQIIKKIIEVNTIEKNQTFFPNIRKNTKRSNKVEDKKNLLNRSLFFLRNVHGQA